MGQYSIDEAYDILMSAAPYSQSSGGAMLRNFAAAAQLMAGHLRTAGTSASGAGDAGAATQAQAERHAAWFDQVASNATEAAGKLDSLAATGNAHQATAEEYYQNYQQALQRDSGPSASGSDDMNVIHQSMNGSTVLSAAVSDWGSAYSSFKMPEAPPPPTTGGARPAASGSAPTGTQYTGGTGTHPTSHFTGPGAVLTSVGTVVSSTPVIDRGPGVPGSVQVGPDGGEFAGWYKDPRTGYYVDPATGREFDPVTNRWIDPVTGQPFGDVTQYATGLQGLGGASTTGGLLADTTATAGTSAAGLAGSGGFAGLFSGGNATAVAGWYGGMVPPSLSSGSAAASSLWQQAGRSLAVKQDVAASMLAREQAVRSGRAYLPPTQAGAGAGGAGGGRRARPGYLTAEEEEAGLFSSRGGRRAYLPPTQAGNGKDEKKQPAGERPDWLVDDDVFGAEPAPSGVLGED
jgi:hypothetical protein